MREFDDYGKTKFEGRLIADMQVNGYMLQTQVVKDDDGDLALLIELDEFATPKVEEEVRRILWQVANEAVDKYARRRRKMQLTVREVVEAVAEELAERFQKAVETLH